MQNIEGIKDYYDQHIAGKLNGFIYGNRRVEYAWNTLNTLLEIKKISTVLEIGCGIGDIAWRLSKAYPGCTITGFDISEKSIEVAKKLFPDKELSFVRADDLSEAPFADVNFDVIFMMDVYEHIPAAARKNLLLFIKNHLAKDGLVFISCPTPRKQIFLRANNPEELQPVEEDISIDVVKDFAKDTGLNIVLYKEVSVWNAGDYLHACFSNWNNMQPFSDFRSNTQPVSLKRELFKRVNKKIGSNTQQKKTANKQAAKKKMVEDTLGLKL